MWGKRTNQPRRRGATGAEYALLLGLIGILALVAVTGSGRAVRQLMTVTGNTLTQATNGTVASAGSSGGGPSGACLDTRASCAAHFAAGCTANGVYTVTGLGAVTCNMSGNGGGWTRCLSLQNTAAEDMIGNSWFDSCVAISNDPGITGNQVWLRLVDSGGAELYSGSGPKTGSWTTDLITSTSTTGQYDHGNHDRRITLNSGHYLKITGKSTFNSGCGGDHGNGYGIFVHTTAGPSNSETVRLLVASYNRPNTGGGVRSFGPGWNAGTEIAHQAPNFSTCGATIPGVLGGTVEFFLK